MTFTNYSIRKSQRVKNQFIAVICGNIAVFTTGAALGWLSPALLTLESKSSPLVSGPLTLEQVGILGGLFFIASTFGNFFFAYLAQKYGFKTVACITAIPSIISWCLVLFTDNVIYLYLARIINGLLTGGIYFCIPLFVTQIADEEIRGMLGTFFSVNFFAGVLFAFILGSYTNYWTTPTVMIGIQVLLFVSLVFIPETPQFLLIRGQTEKAEKSLRFYKNCYGLGPEESARFTTEMNKVKMYVKQQTNESLTWSELFAPKLRRSFLTSFIMVMLGSLNGGPIITMYAIRIFAHSGSSLDPKMCSIIFNSIQLISTIPSLFLIDKIGRRLLLILSTFGCILALVVLGIFNYLASSGFDTSTFSWVPVTSLSFSVFCSCGIGPVVIVIIPEVFPPKIRTIGMLFAMTSNNILLSLTSIAFPIVVEIIQLYSFMLIFVTACTIGLIYSIFVLRDTTAQNVNDA